MNIGESSAMVCFSSVQMSSSIDMELPGAEQNLQVQGVPESDGSGSPASRHFPWKTRLHMLHLSMYPFIVSEHLVQFASTSISALRIFGTLSVTLGDPLFSRRFRGLELGVDGTDPIVLPPA